MCCQLFHTSGSRITIIRFAGGEDFVVGFAARQAVFLGGELEGFLAVEFGLVDEFFDALREALHGVGRGAGIGGVFRADQERDFTFRGTIFEGGEKFGEFATTKFFVELGDFASDAGSTIAENFAGVGNAFCNAVRGFVKNDGAILDAEVFEGTAALAASSR